MTTLGIILTASAGVLLVGYCIASLSIDIALYSLTHKVKSLLSEKKELL